MSNYLSHLVTRNLGWTNSLQPRKRGLFEMPTEGTELRWSPPYQQTVRQDDTNRKVESSEAETSVTELENNFNPLQSWVTVKNESQAVDFSLELINHNSQTNSLLPHRIIEPSSSFPINSPGISDNFNESFPSESQDVGFSVELSENKSQTKVFSHEHQGIEPKIVSRENPDSSTLRDVTPSPQSSPSSSTNSTELAEGDFTDQSLFSDPKEAGYSVDFVSQDTKPQSSPTYGEQTENKSLSLLATPQPSTIHASSLLTTPSYSYAEGRGINGVDKQQKNSPRTHSTERLRHPTENSYEPKITDESQTELVPKTDQQLLRPITKVISPQKTPETAPSIRVTIGRIEVQAHQPPEPSLPSPEPFSPQLSLEAYLKLRQGDRE